MAMFTQLPNYHEHETNSKIGYDLYKNYFPVTFRLSHYSCSSRHTVCQQSAVARFWLQPLCSGTLCQMTFSLHHQFLPSVDF